jgi:outer membrane protein with beta-barrel domain
MTKKILVVATVLLVHTAAAQAQQSAPVVPGAGTPGAEAFPPAYAPPPGYKPPSAPAQQPYYGPGPTYGAPPTYNQPGYGPPPGHYPPPNYYYRYPPPPPRQVTDRPFTLGGGIGFGGISFKDSLGNTATESGMAYTFRLGFGLRPGLLLLWDVEGAWVSKNGTSTSQTANLAALQLFATNRLFFKAGFGLAAVVHSYDDGYETRSDWGGAAMVGMGYELIQGWNWSLDIEATVTGARYSYETGVAGANVDENWTNWSLVNFALNFF